LFYFSYPQTALDASVTDFTALSTACEWHGIFQKYFETVPSSTHFLVQQLRHHEELGEVTRESFLKEGHAGFVLRNV